jgi:hypothetical protein
VIVNKRTMTKKHINILIIFLLLSISESLFSQKIVDSLKVTQDQFNLYEKRKNLKWIGDINSDSIIEIHLNGAKINPEKEHLKYYTLLKILKAIQNENYIIIVDDFNKVQCIFKIDGEGYIDSYKKFHSNGKIKITGDYDSNISNKKIGKWFYYDKNGKLKKVKYYNF